MAIELQETAKNHNSYVYADMFLATVVSCDPGTNAIIVAPDGQNNHDQLQGIPLSSTFSAALGFVETVLPTIGTRVLCIGKNDNRTFIIGSIPYPDNQGNLTNPTLPNKAILGTVESLFQSVHNNGYLDKLTKQVIHNNNLPTDVLQGEKVFSNEFGIMLGLFKLMATLKASELSQIQCHFLDDLVRIISHNFQHYTSLGELKVFHDGQGIHLEAGATHIPSESLGSPTSDDTDNGDNTGIGIQNINNTQGYDQFYALSDPQLIMLERMKLFVGKLGQFINLLITNPSQEQHALNGNAPNTPDAGLLQFKASLDGTLVVRSVSGIYLEKTNWIRVPQRIRTPEDPNGDDGVTLNYPEQKAYNFDNTYQFRETAFLYYLQLRDYLAYINEEIGYANFNAQTKDFYVNNDKNNEQPLENITFIDQETGIAYTQTKSWVSLMNNGGISLADAWGSSITMEGGNIYIQPAKDLVIQPNRNLVAKIGDNVSIAAQGELDLSSTNGGLRVKTTNAQYFYSKFGGIILHSDGPDFENDIVTFNDDPEGMITNISGIMINAPNSGVTTYGNQIYHNAIETYIAKSPQITLDSSEIIRLLSDEELTIYGDDVNILSSTETINYSSGENTTLGLGSTIIGQKGQYFGIANILGGEAPVQGILDASNNKEQSFFTTLSQLLSTSVNFDITTVIETFSDDAEFSDIQFQFPPTDLYNLDLQVDVIPQPLSQQTNTINNMYNLQPWIEDSINNTYPYPGSDFNISLASVAVNNVQPDAASNINISNKATGLMDKSTIILADIFQDYQSM